MSALEELAQAMRAEGGLLAGAAAAPAGDDSGHAAAAAGRSAEHAFLVEAIHEGYLAHYGSPRLIATPDSDLALLAGDHLYATGLAKLAELGDLDGVRILADVISRCAQAHAEGRPDDARAAWEAGVIALTRGA